MALREILVALGFEFDKAQESQVLSAIGTIKKAALGLGIALSAKAIAGFVADTVEGVARAGDEIDELAQKIGVSAQALQELAPIAAKNGASIGDLATSLRILSKNAFDARGGSKELQAGFSQLGVSVTDSNGQLKSAEQLFTELSEGFAGMTDETERTALAQKLLGRSGTQLIPTLLKGSEELARQRQEAHALGLVMSDELLQASSRFTDAQKDQEGAIQGLKNALAEELMPAYTLVLEATTRLIKKARPFVQAFGRGLVTALESLGRVLRALAQPIPMLIIALTALALTFNAVGIAGVAAAVMSAAAWVIATAPILFMIALLAIIGTAIFLLIEDFQAMGEGAESVTGTIIQGFQDLVTELGSIPAAIGAMLAEAFFFWVEFFGGSRKETKQFIDDIVGWFDLGLSNIKQFFMDLWETIKPIVNMQGLAMLGRLVGIGNPAGVASSGALSSAAGGSSMVNQPNTSILVNVDASGASDPNAVGRATGAAVSGASEEAMLRQTRMTFATSPAGG